jgi:hypothetical protein
MDASFGFVDIVLVEERLHVVGQIAEWDTFAAHLKAMKLSDSPDGHCTRLLLAGPHAVREGILTGR